MVKSNLLSSSNEPIATVFKFLDQQALSNLLVSHLVPKNAFECVPHKLLISKQQNKAFWGKLLNLIESLLFQTLHYVKFNFEKLEKFVLHKGVLQGSIFFTIYIHDLPETVNEQLYCDFLDDYNAVSTDHTAMKKTCSYIALW